MPQNDLLDADLLPSVPRRRTLLPIWVKFFLWIFMIFGAIAPIGFIMGILGMNFNISLYGLETYQAFSLTGLFLLAIYALKGVVSFGLWTEKNWAVDLAIIDAVIGILTCTSLMFVLPFLGSEGFLFTFRLELAILIPYLIKMYKIRLEWKIAKIGN